MTSAGLAGARYAGVGHRSIHCRQTGSTGGPGVCRSMTSLTSTAHGSVAGSRQGSSRAASAYQSTIVSPTGTAEPLPASGPAAGEVVRTPTSLPAPPAASGADRSDTHGHQVG